MHFDPQSAARSARFMHMTVVGTLVVVIGSIAGYALFPDLASVFRAATIGGAVVGGLTLTYMAIMRGFHV